MDLSSRASKMRLLGILIIASVLLVSPLLGNVYAIVNGQPDGNAHPYVCMVAVYDADGHYLWRGSGTLISSRVVLTAGHVTYGATYAAVWFDSSLGNNMDYKADFGWPSGIQGIPHTDPDFCMGCKGGLPGFLTHDVGVVVLDDSIKGKDFGTLPTVGLVDTLPMKTKVDIVGYGVQTLPRGGGPPMWIGERTRYVATGELITANFVQSDEFIRLTGNPAKDKGATTFGDSGGPTFLAGTKIILAVTSYGPNYICSSVSYNYRVDLADVQDWITEITPGDGGND
jgi:V8-like Glu-specific endopeptidase